MNNFKKKRAIFLIVLFNCTLINNTFSQKLKPLAQLVKETKIAKSFYSVKPFETSLNVRGNSNQRKYASYLKEESVVQISDRAFQRLYDNSTGALTLTIPYKGSNIELEVVEQEVVSEDFTIKTSQSSRPATPNAQGKFYRGIIKGDNESMVSLSIFNDEMTGQISSELLGNITIAKAPAGESPNDYLIYADDDLLIHGDFKCETADLDSIPRRLNLSTRGSEQPILNKKVRIYYECDYDLYLNKGSNVDSVARYVRSIFNNVATIYMNEGITMTISDIFVWTSPSPYSRTSSNMALYGFASARGNKINADLGQLLTYGGNARGGLAYVGTLCYPDYSFSYANINDTYAEFPTYSWTVMVMAHELGHNLGSQHTQWCGWQGGPIDNCAKAEGSCTTVGPAPVNGGTIMSYCMGSPYGVRFSNGFGSLPGGVIRNMVSSSNCLASICASTVSPNIKNVTLTSAELEWAPVSDAVSYKIEYKKPSDTIWTSGTTSATSFLISNLPVYDSLQVRVSSICALGLMVNSPVLRFKTLNNTTCSIETTPSVSDVTQTTSTLSWTPVQGATSYTLEYQEQLQGVSIKEYTPLTTKTLTNLAGGKNYNISVSATCTDITGSPSALVQFATPSSLPSTVLPLNWLSFSVKSMNIDKKPQIALEWVTGDEKDIQSFSIERSVNAKAFYTIKDNISPNNTPDKHTYTVIDDNPLMGTSYYRIRQTGYDGKSTVSKIQSVSLNNQSLINKFTIFPNPSTKDRPLSISTDSEGEYTVKIIDLTGRIFYNATLTGNVELKNVEFTGGMYFYEITSGYQRSSGKIFVAE